MTGSTAIGSKMRADTAEHAGTGKKTSVALWVLQVLVAGVFFLAGLSKMIFPLEIFHQIGWGMWFQYLTGVLEMVGAVALLIRRTSGVAALAFVGLAICAVNFHVFVLDSSLIPVALLGICAAIIAYGRRHTISALLGDVFGRR